MLNFIKCSTILIGDKSIYCIGYKYNQEDFYLLSRKMIHDFKVTVNRHYFENAVGLTIDDVDHFIVASEGYLIMYDDNTYQERYKVDLQLKKLKTGEATEIIAVQKGKNRKINYLSVSVGKTLINGSKVITEIIILRLEKKKKEL